MFKQKQFTLNGLPLKKGRFRKNLYEIFLQFYSIVITTNGSYPDVV